MTQALAQRYGWHPNLVLDETSVARLWPFLWPSGEARTPHDPDRVRAAINKRRAAKGLPPMKPSSRRP